MTIALCLAASIATAAAELWPEPPADASVPKTGDAAEDAIYDYRYAAGLYRSLEELLSRNHSKLSQMDADGATLLTRALLSQGREEEIAALLDGREDIPAELQLQFILANEDAVWSDLDLARWRAHYAADDAESLYWLARLEMKRGDPELGRQLLSRLLRREPGSVFAPAALELLESMPTPRSLPETTSIQPEADANAEAAPGIRIQWGVFRDPLRARRQREALLAYEQPVEILSFVKDGNELYRVCSPAYALEEDAREAGDLIRTRYGLEYVIHRGDNSP